MKLTICLVFVLLSFGSFAQKGDSLPCPKIKLDAQRAGRVSVGTDAVISVRPFKKNLVNPDSLAYEWISDIGVIKKGKNERSVHIDTKGLVGQQIKVVVIVHGLRAGCPSTATTTLNVVPPIIITETKIIRRPAKR